MSKFLHAIILEELQEFTYMRSEVKNKKLERCAKKCEVLSDGASLGASQVIQFM